MCKCCMTQCKVVISNVTCYKRDYEVILFKSVPSFKPTGTNLHLNPRYRNIIQALILQHIFKKKFDFL